MIGMLRPVLPSVPRGSVLPRGCDASASKPPASALGPASACIAPLPPIELVPAAALVPPLPDCAVMPDEVPPLPEAFAPPLLTAFEPAPAGVLPPAPPFSACPSSLQLGRNPSAAAAASKPPLT